MRASFCFAVRCRPSRMAGRRGLLVDLWREAEDWDLGGSHRISAATVKQFEKIGRGMGSGKRPQPATMADGKFN